MNTNNLERLQAMLDHANAKAREEDCIHRLENRKLVLELDRKNVLRSWAGDWL